MASSLKRYFEGFQGAIAATTDTTVITPNGQEKLAVLSIVVYNPTAAAITVKVNVRRTASGAVEAAATANELVNESLAAKGRLTLSGTPYLILPNGAVISVNGSALGLNAWVSAEIAERNR